MGETKTSKEESTFTLPNETVIVKYINRKRGMAANVDDNHVISGGMLSGAKKKFSAPLQRNGSVANVLTKEEKDYLEKVTGLDLSVYGKFWETFTVSLFKDDANNIFELSQPMDYISIAILKSLKHKVAKSWAERNNKQTYEFVITSGNEVQHENKVKLDTKKLAFKLYGKIEDDKDKLMSVLKLLTNQTVSKNSDLDWLQGKVQEYVDTMPSSFVNVIQDPSFDTKALINKGIDAGVILRNSNLYSTIDGLDLCEMDQVATFDNAVKYLDNNKNQEVRTLIEARINKGK